MLISVITPVYNRADCIERCLNSVANAKDSNLEVEHIVVDDGSSDDTYSIIQQYASNHPWVKPIRLDVNRGTNAARNAAIKAAKGQFIILLDSDDYFNKDVFLVIEDTLKRYDDYRYYMFVPDDMQASIAGNRSLHGVADDGVCELRFKNFLSGEVGGDFIHLIDAGIMKSNLFDEDVRIHEGVFFLSFYKEAERMLFRNRIITHRERNRRDSVTRETIRTERKFINRSLEAQKICFHRFSDDFIKHGCSAQYQSLLISIIDNNLLLEDYNDAAFYAAKLCELPAKMPLSLSIIMKMRLGGLYRLILKLFLTLKYSFKKTLQ